MRLNVCHPQSILFSCANLDRASYLTRRRAWRGAVKPLQTHWRSLLRNTASRFGLPGHVPGHSHGGGRRNVSSVL